MRHRLRYVLLLSCLSLSLPLTFAGHAPAQPVAAEAVKIPDTAAGKRFSTWLKDFNNADRAGLTAFMADLAMTPKPPVEALLNLRQRTGGFDLRKVEASEEHKITVLLKERESDQFVRIVFELDPASVNRVLSLPLMAIPTPAEFAVPRLSDAALGQQLGAELKTLEASDKFSGTVLIAKAGKTVFSGAYGDADRERKLRNDMDTRFRFGSMGKMFTATAVMQLVQSGKIALTDPVGKFLPDYPNKDIAQKVTVEQLLTHQGGTGDIFTPEFMAQGGSIKTLQDYVAMFGARAPRYEPGARFEYSNYGFVLLGRIVEAVSGESYYDYLDRHIFKPTGMTSTGLWPESQAVPKRAVGYAAGPQGLAPNIGMPTERASPAGGGISTAQDMLRFAQALLDHKLLDAAHTQMLLTGRVQMGPDTKYAFGFGDTARGTAQHRVGHSGGAPGQNGELIIYPEAGYVVVVLSNFDPPAAQRVSGYITNRLGI